MHFSFLLQSFRRFCDVYNQLVFTDLMVSNNDYRPRSEAKEGYVFTGIHLSNEGGMTPNASRDRSHGQGGGGPVLGQRSTT